MHTGPAWCTNNEMPDCQAFPEGVSGNYLGFGGVRGAFVDPQEGFLK